ncbi:MAG: hypothetical protein H6668_10345 [Ardenticatenaceae bacterium]|nr:hypothetical protein [Ardenticatenaceae bacterium]
MTGNGRFCLNLLEIDELGLDDLDRRVLRPSSKSLAVAGGAGNYRGFDWRGRTRLWTWWNRICFSLAFWSRATTCTPPPPRLRHLRVWPKTAFAANPTSQPFDTPRRTMSEIGRCCSPLA